jgi:hypothetical protein
MPMHAHAGMAAPSSYFYNLKGSREEPFPLPQSSGRAEPELLY